MDPAQGSPSYSSVLLISAQTPIVLGAETPVVRFGEESKTPGSWAGRRLMFLGEEPAFELSFWCGTCQLLFRRLEGANETLSLESMQQRLNDGLHDIDSDVVAEFGTLLAKGEFLPMLLEVQPQLVWPSDPNDYFAHEQVATWGLDALWGLPVYPSSSYYRTYTTAVDTSAHLYEFVVPMVPPAWSDGSRVSVYIEALSSSALPTAVAVSILDICAPASGPGTDNYTHWGLTHFLLDGHHKMQAAAESNQKVRLLTLLSIDGSLAAEESIRLIPGIRRRPATARTERDAGRSARF
jgi:hypothetical protein